MKSQVNLKFGLIVRNMTYIFISLGFATSFSIWLDQLGWPEATIILTYLLSVFMVSRLLEGFIYGVVASIGSVLMFNFLFTQPRFSLNVDSAEYIYTFLIMLLVSIITSTLTQKVTQETKLADEREARVHLLVDISRDFFQSVNLEHAIMSLIKNLSTNVQSEIFVSLQRKEPHMAVYYPNDITSKKVFERINDGNVFEYIQLKNKEFPHLIDYYFPIQSNTGSFGLLCLMKNKLNTSQIELVEACCAQLALAQDRQFWIEKQQFAMLEVEREKLRVQLLSAISHDLRTPLSGIIGTVLTLIENRDSIDDKTSLSLLNNIHSDSNWLLESVENVLSLMKIKEGTSLFDLQDYYVEEIIEETLSLFSNLHSHKLQATIPDQSVLIYVDSKLIVRVLVNLIQNAIKFSEYNSMIILKVSTHKDRVIFEVKDEGVGMSDAEKLMVFEQFFSKPSLHLENRQGMGLGLSISKAIIEAHNGTIRVLNNTPKGSIFMFTLQMKETP